MSDIGTITEIEPEDGLGWIELPSGDRVRFGGTACKGFVPAVGMRVQVVGTRPGYGGTVKATELRRAADDAPASAGGAAALAGMAAPASGAAPTPAPRTHLHTFQQAGVRSDDLLQMLLGRADVDDGLHADLERIAFELQPQPGPALGCRNPWFYAVAMDGGGNAYGLYVHPLFENHPAPPWLYWDRELDTLRWLADDSSVLLRDVLATAAASGVDPAVVSRLHAVLVKLGMADEGGRVIEGGVEVGYLPPDAAALRPIDAYLAETDGAEMERGLLAHAFRHSDQRAMTALRSIYDAWEWTLPAWVS